MDMPPGFVPEEFYEKKFLFNPYRLSIIRLLMKYPKLSTVEIKNTLDLSWNTFNSHLLALKNKNFVFIDHTMDEEGMATYVSLQPDALNEFKNLTSMLRLFLESVHATAQVD